MLIAAPFVFMILTPYMINLLKRVYTGNHHNSVYVKRNGGFFENSSPPIYAIEICPSDFLTLEGEYYFAIPVWCVGVLLYLGFWLTHKRGSHFNSYPLEKKVGVSLLLLFSASIVGALVLTFTFLTGFVGKFLVYLVGNVESTWWNMDSMHFQIGIATAFGAGLFVLLMSQFLESEDSSQFSSEQKDKPVPLVNFPEDNLIDFD